MPQRATFKVLRLYKAAAKVVSVIKSENGNLEELVEQYNKKTNVKALAALVSKTVNNEDLLNRIIENSEILTKEPKEDPWLLRVLITELLLGKQRLPIGSNTIQTLLSYGPILRTELMKAQGKRVGKHKKSKHIGEGYDNETESKVESIASESNENTRKKKQKRKKDIQESVEVDEENLQQIQKKQKKSKKKRKDKQETLPCADKDLTMDVSIDTSEQLPKLLLDEEQDYINSENDELTTAHLTKLSTSKKKKKKSKKSTHND